MINDLRFALRMISGHRWFAAAVIVTLALGIGINTTVFTLLNAVLYKPVPVPGGGRLVTIATLSLTRSDQRTGVSWPDFLEYKQRNQTFEGMEAASRSQGVISEPSIPPGRFNLARVTPGFFALIHTPPVTGRAFVPSDGAPGAEPVVVLSHDTWQNRYGGARDAVGRVVRVNGVPATIIGVMPPGCKLPTNEDCWMPLVPDADLVARGNHALELFGLLRDGGTIAEARADLAVIAGRIALSHPDTNRDTGVLVRDFHETYNGAGIRTVLRLMLGAVACVLLIACANVANLMLGRSVGRAREFAVRAALGAARWQLVRQLLVESILLSVIGGGLGLGLSAGGVHVFDLATRSVGKPAWIVFEMDWVAFAYFAALTIGSGFLFGLVPALRASRVDLTTAIKDGTPAGGTGRGRLSGGLVVLQFALTVVLLAGAGMLIRGFFAVQALNAFVHPRQVLTAQVQLPESAAQRYAAPEARREFFRNLLTELRNLPGITAAAAATNLPGLGATSRPVAIEGRPDADPNHPPRAAVLVETPEYLAAIGLPLLAGRGFTATDGGPGQAVAVVSQDFAARHWPGTTALGRRFRFAAGDQPGDWTTVIGVAANLVQDPSDKNLPPVVHLPHRQESNGRMTVLVRTPADPATLAGALRAAVQKADPDLPLSEVRTLAVALAQQASLLGVFGTLFSTFALTGLLMASVGIYAVVAQSTASRTREIGVRMALGATGGQIARMVLSRGLTQLFKGLGLGLIGCLAATRLLDRVGFLIGMSPHDPLVFAGIAALLLALGLLACWLPARRAARIAPTEALRAE